MPRQPDPGRRSADRGSWPVHVFRLGEAPGDDLSGVTTAVQRLGMMWPLALEAWTLAGRSLPAYGRRETPLTRRAWTVRP